MRRKSSSTATSSISACGGPSGTRMTSRTRTYGLECFGAAAIPVHSAVMGMRSLKRVGQPDDVVSVIEFLASDALRRITGPSNEREAVCQTKVARAVRPGFHPLEFRNARVRRMSRTRS